MEHQKSRSRRRDARPARIRRTPRPSLEKAPGPGDRASRRPPEAGLRRPRAEASRTRRAPSIRIGANWVLMALERGRMLAHGSEGPEAGASTWSGPDSAGTPEHPPSRRARLNPYILGY